MVLFFPYVSMSFYYELTFSNDPQKKKKKKKLTFLNEISKIGQRGKSMCKGCLCCYPKQKGKPNTHGPLNKE